MELRNVDIKNFKSIENIELDLEKDCKIIVGLSESGKSNFLTALRTLDSSFTVDKTYVKEGTRKDNNSLVDFELIFTDKEKNIIINELTKNSLLKKLILKDGNEVDLFDFLDDRIVLRVDIRTNKRQFIYYENSEIEKYTLNVNYKYINATPTKKMLIKNIADGSQKEISSFTIVSVNEYQIEVENSIDSLYSIIEELIIKMVQEKQFELPKVLFWEYDEKYLLPAEVNINDFINNNDICVPLKNMFKLCNIDNIGEEYADKKEMGESSFQNLLDDISDTVDTYLKKVWKSMPKDTKIILQEVGDIIKIRIKDNKNSYSVAKRSDGFKRLVTFLLMLSINNKNNSLNNTLLLIDEPDSKIDIPGQEYLRDELINIGKNNYVIYSTHSTDMIDNKKLERHIIIKKHEESSIIEFANDNNYMDIATLYRALGMNVYAVINEQNLVFEGWTDQLIFELYTGKRNSFFKNIGVTHLAGITKANQYAEFWGLLSKKYFIISDSDETAIQMKNSFQENRFSGIWITYGELCDEKIVTLEDFITDEKILKVAKDYKKENGYSMELDEKILKNYSGKLEAIQEWIILNSGKKDIKNKVKDFKSKLYDNIKKSDINDEYAKFIKELKGNVEENS